ncbi:uncharacterized protein N7482_006185 [Penicillium canariense]|uniref:Uncharacterized protein n=1 Tax=Penicillium canariense TaxID=189055 RepID=A0A9W9I684_9EURO|nr:uncharacterized protein N7482_006185 [Penicillium canariense]KAJ5167404.1 hypothetical protein N7482_006185 [Penicillium canariense]
MRNRGTRVPPIVAVSSEETESSPDALQVEELVDVEVDTSSNEELPNSSLEPSPASSHQPSPEPSKALSAAYSAPSTTAPPTPTLVAVVVTKPAQSTEKPPVLGLNSGYNPITTGSTSQLEQNLLKVTPWLGAIASGKSACVPAAAILVLSKAAPPLVTGGDALFYRAWANCNFNPGGKKCSFRTPGQMLPDFILEPLMEHT